MIFHKTSEKNKVWQVKCGRWISKTYNIRSEASRVQRVLDEGTCMCENHEPYYAIKA